MFNPNGNNSQDDEDKKTTNTLIVVKKSVPKDPPNINLDPLWLRINQIAVFNPIIDENVKKFPWSKSSAPKVSSNIGSRPLVNIGHLYNGYIRRNTEILVRDQSLITKKIKHVDSELGKMMKIFMTRQKEHATIASKFGQVPDIYRRLTKAQSSLNNLIHFITVLEDVLDELSVERDPHDSLQMIMSEIKVPNQSDSIGLVPSDKLEN